MTKELKMENLYNLIDSIINNDSDSKDIFHQYLTEKIQVLLERNIVNQNEIKSLIKGLEQNATNPNVKKWLNSSFRKYILNNHTDTKKYQAKDSDPDWMKSNDPLVVSFSPQFRSEAREVVDYLNTVTGSINMNYMQAKNAAQRAQEQRMKEVEKELDKNETRHKSILAEPGTEVVKDYGDGFKWVKLTSPEALKYESHIMKHCVGDEEQGYISGVKSKKLMILSLRDKKNIPHVTIEVIKPNTVQQIKGKANSGVKPQYVKYVKDILKTGVMGIKFDDVDDVEDLYNIGIVVANGGIWYDMYRLPKGLTIDGDLNMYDMDITSLPDNLTVEGSLLITGTKITSLPKNLTVGKDLFAENLKITSLPSDLNVGRDLYISQTNITSLPDGLTINGDLSLMGIKTLKSLPNKLSVAGSLNLYGTPIKTIPNDLKVGSTLNLLKTHVKTRPDNPNIKSIVFDPNY